MKSDTKIIEANFHAPIYFNLDDLGVDADDIADYWIKWGTLHLILKDGSEKSFDGDASDPDYKWPIHEQEWTEEFAESVRPIKKEKRIIIEEEEIKEEED